MVFIVDDRILIFGSPSIFYFTEDNSIVERYPMPYEDWVTSTDYSNDFECIDCGTSFSKEVPPGENPTCPLCGSFEVDRQSYSDPVP